MQVPTIAECARLMEQFAMLPNIRRHSLVVARIADLLVSCLEKTSSAGQAPDRQLCISGALLHDIAKTPCLNEACNHATTGARICRELGYPEIAVIVEEHVILSDHDPDRYSRGVFSAREIVYYADKRVRHDEIVSLDDRLEYILKNYGNNDARRYALIRENFSRCVELEQFIFRFIDFPPEQLGAEIYRNDCPLDPSKINTYPEQP
jgi:putative nucleotidyltransferase with HDIG domain